MEEDRAFAPLPSDFVERYSEAAIENDAAIPVINPATAINLVFCKAKVNPARVPVNSTKASFNPKTIDPT